MTEQGAPKSFAMTPFRRFLADFQFVVEHEKHPLIDQSYIDRLRSHIYEMRTQLLRASRILTILSCLVALYLVGAIQQPQILPAELRLIPGIPEVAAFFLASNVFVYLERLMMLSLWSELINTFVEIKYRGQIVGQFARIKEIPERVLIEMVQPKYQGFQSGRTHQRFAKAFLIGYFALFLLLPLFAVFVIVCTLVESFLNPTLHWVVSYSINTVSILVLLLSLGLILVTSAKKYEYSLHESI